MPIIKREKLYFDRIKEHRGSYFVEYEPPFGNSGFAMLYLVYPDGFELSDVAENMRTEMHYWIGRYPVPVMVSALDVTEDIIRPNGSTSDGALFGWLEPGETKIASSWSSDKLPAFVSDAGSLPDLRTVYNDITFKTDAEVKANAARNLQKTLKQNLTLKIILLLWLAVIPAAWAIIQFFGPNWLALAVLAYALWQAFKAWRKLTGRIKPSGSEIKMAETQRKMDHYFYHCERNPDGFFRLMVENLTKDISDRTRKEAEELARKR